MRARLLSLAAPALLRPDRGSSRHAGCLRGRRLPERAAVQHPRRPDPGRLGPCGRVERHALRRRDGDARTCARTVGNDRVQPGTTELVVDPSMAVTPASGDYTFIKVRVFRSTGNGADPAKWIMPTPVAPPATGPKVKMSTFNVSSGREGEGQEALDGWKKRRPHVITIVASKPGILVVQEAVGPQGRRRRQPVAVPGPGPPPPRPLQAGRGCPEDARGDITASRAPGSSTTPTSTGGSTAG